METFEFRLRLSIVALVLYRVSIGVGVEDLQTHVDTDDTASFHMLTLSFGLNSELSVVSIGAAQEADPLDLLHWESFDMLSGTANQAQATTKGESDVASIRVYLPSGGFVLHTSVIMLKCRVPLLSRFLVPAILIEAGDGSPGTVGTGLTGLGIEACSKRVRLSEHGTIALEVILVNLASVHPEAEALVTDELHDAKRFIDSRVLLLIAVEFVLVDQHPSCLPVCSLLY